MIVSIQIKKCSNCGVTKSTIGFNNCKLSRDGLRYECRNCQRMYKKQYSQSHKFQTKKYRQEHKVQLSIYKKQYRQEHKDQAKQYLQITS